MRARDRLAYLRGEHAEEALLVGWICLLAHTLFLPVLALVPALGYLVATARAVIGGEEALPPVEFRALFSEGLAAGAICLLYGLIPATIGAVTVSLATETAIDPQDGATLFFLIGSTTTLFVVLAGLYALPIALCRYAVGGIRDALPSRAFLAVGTHAAYFIGWTSALLLLAAGGLGGGVIEIVPVVGPILAALVWWITAIVAARRLAAAYRTV
ncbi:DUF4013 domain-containing protein [Halalkalicoccus tibetensis]|uniref:DUF4013 domain-containing protein n=1 Tax=Halalkalicoccus tibetensis TaxID=175632 RepID=A0ABD5UZT7_9EURY